MKKHILYIFLMVSSLYHAPLYTAVKGSTTTVSIEPSFEFLATDTDNTIQGFAWFKNGFTLQDATTSCDFASVYPVSGTINLNGGTLHLLEDLILKNFTTFQGLGIIKGNNYYLEFCSSITTLPENSELFEDVYLALSNSIELQGNTTFAGSTVLDGRGHTVQLGENGGIIVASNATLQLKDMIIKGISAQNIRCFDDTATLILDNVQWVQDADVTFEQGSLYIKDKAEFYGNFAFTHTSNKPVSIGKQSIWTIQASIDLEIGKRSTPDAVDPLIFEDHSSVLKLSNCSLFVTNQGLRLTKGRLIFDEEVEIDMQSTNTTNGIIIGDGIDPENDFSVRFNSGVSVTHAGHTVYNNTSPNKLHALSKNAKIIREANSNIFMATNVVMPSMTFESMLNSVPPIQGAQGISITYQDDQVLFPAVAFDITGRQEETNTFLLEGNNELFFTKGSLPLDLRVSGTNNFMHGNGGISGLLSLQDNSTELMCAVLGPISKSPVLNGGKIKLLGDFVLGPDIVLTGSGTVDLASCCAHIGAKDIVWTGSTVWQGNDGSIDMRAQIALTGMWRVEGQVTINGNDNTLALGTQGTIVIAPDATLRCKNVRLTGISETNISCEDDSASLILEDVIWVQDGNFTFPAGSLAIKDEVDFLGSYTFSYESKQTSTIQLKSEWHITDDMRFEIGKQLDGGAWPLNFVDHTSVLHLDNCNYVITDSGMRIIKGTIMYSRDVAIEIQSTDTTNGSFIGNGIAADDPVVQFNPGAAARFLSGHMIWDVIDSNKLRSDSTTVQITRTGGNTYYIKQDLTLKKFTVSSDASIKTIIAPGKKLGYDQCLFKLPNGQIAITGNRYNEYASLLDGNDSIFLHYGTLPLVTYVMGTGNRIEGNGTVTGPIVLLGPTSVLNCNVRGTLEGNLMLNGGTVNLEGGLMLADDAIISTGGMINLGSYALDLPSQQTTWASTILWSGMHANINMHSKTTLAGQWIFTADCTMNGNGNVLDLSSGGKFIINDGVTVTFKDVRLSGIDALSIVMMGEQSALILDSMTWVQKGDVYFDTGSIRFVEDVEFVGSFTFQYDSASTSTVAIKSTWHVSDGMTLALGRKTMDGENPLFFEDGTSTLNLDNCHFHVTENGLQFSRGRVLCSRDVLIDIASTSMDNGLYLGNGTPDGDMVFECYPGCSVNFTNGHVVYDITQPDSVKSRSTTAKLIRDADSVFQIQQNVILENLTIEASLYAVTNVAEGKSFAYQNCALMLPSGSIVANALRYNAYTNLLGGNESIFLAAGANPMYTIVSGTGNYIIGNGSITGQTMLQDAQAQLILAVDGLVTQDISLNGGAVVLGADLKFAGGKHFVGDGFVTLVGNQVTFGPQDSNWTGNIVWQGDGGQIDFNASVALSSSWTVNGEMCVMHCHGNTIDLSGGGEIIVNNDSVLHIKDAEIKGIAGTNIRCLSDTSKLILENVTWVQSDDYQFAQGAITWRHENALCGDATFVYQTVETSTICERSCVCLDFGFTFSYDPLVTGTLLPPLNLLVFHDATSSLELNSATVWAVPGIELTKGTVSIKKNSTFVSTTTDTGITIGSGSSADDCKILLSGGAQLTVAQGALNYKNKDAASWLSGNNLSTLYLADNTLLNLYQSLNVGVGGFLFGNNTTLNRAVGLDITGALTVQGELSFGSL